jgi:hypothetical protein
LGRCGIACRYSPSYGTFCISFLISYVFNDLLIPF